MTSDWPSFYHSAAR